MSAMDEVRRRLTADLESCMWRLAGEDYECNPAPNRDRCAACLARDEVDKLLAKADSAIRADEREACAKVADGETEHWRTTAEHLKRTGYPDRAAGYSARGEASATVGALIRARGKP